MFKVAQVANTTIGKIKIQAYNITVNFTIRCQTSPYFEAKKLHKK